MAEILREGGFSISIHKTAGTSAVVAVEPMLIDHPPKRPTIRGKPPEQREAERAAWLTELRAFWAVRAKAKNQRLIDLGITHYEWVSHNTCGPCHVAQRNHGKIFEFANPPPEGNPGEGGECNDPECCHCFALLQVRFGQE